MKTKRKPQPAPLNENDAVNHPAHYGGENNPYEAIKVIEAWQADFCVGNTLKYLSRAGKKTGESTVQDLEKAQWYLQRKIEQLKGMHKPVTSVEIITIPMSQLSGHEPRRSGKNVAPVNTRKSVKKRKK